MIKWDHYAYQNHSKFFKKIQICHFHQPHTHSHTGRTFQNSTELSVYKIAKNDREKRKNCELTEDEITHSVNNRLTMLLVTCPCMWNFYSSILYVNYAYICELWIANCRKTENPYLFLLNSVPFYSIPAIAWCGAVEIHPFLVEFWKLNWNGIQNYC